MSQDEIKPVATAQDCSQESAENRGGLDKSVSSLSGNALQSQPSHGDAAYRAALEFLYSRIDYEKIGHAPYTSRNYRLDRMRRLLELLGDPHLAYPVIHIAGTKGKGTTSHVLSDALQASGFRTGLFTSPHLRDLEERFRIDGEAASAAQLVRLTQAVRDAAELLQSRDGDRPTFFELTTAMAFLHFARAGAQCAVVEVGLGGRLDSTNVCTPLVCVITSISLDHQQQLGETIAEIANEKAGIIKQAVPVVCTARHPDARAVIARAAAERDAPLSLIDRDFQVDWHAMAHPPDGSVQAEIRYRTLANQGIEEDSQWPLRMLGKHQAENVAGAITVLRILGEMGWDVDRKRVIPAVAGCQPPARLEVISHQPLAVVDTAHNAASLRAGLEALQAHFPGRRITAVFASSHDKDYRGMLRELRKHCVSIVLTRYLHNPRACPVSDLQQAVADMEQETPSSCQVLTAATPAEAWERGQWQLSPEAVLYATGSFFLAAELPPLAGAKR